MLTTQNVKKKLFTTFIYICFRIVLQYHTGYIFFFLCNISVKNLKLFLVENQFFKILTLKFCLVKHPAPNQEDITSL